jgi:pre-mRNA-splicing factor ISY1
MARNQEKAMSTLNRWVDQRRVIESGGLVSERVSRFPGECRSVKEGEVARSNVNRRLTSMISQIQNASLGEQKIRDLNDDINKLLRQKYAWEMQIIKLGGPDYRSVGSRLTETEGVEIPGQRGYKYFGAAKDLPDVRELLAVDDDITETRKTRKDLVRHLNSDYYGWYDDQDKDLILAEEEAEAAYNMHISQGTESDPSPYALNPCFIQVEPLMLDKVLLEQKKRSLLATYLNNHS